MKMFFLTGVLLVALAACSPQPSNTKPSASAASSTAQTQTLNGSDIAQENIGDALQLTDHHGKAVSLADFKGKVVAVSFGFTHCPDVCPTNLLDLAKVTTLLGPDADQLQVLFVSVDPTRDTPQVLQDYVPLFHERFLGLTAPDDATMAPVLKAWKIAATKVPVSEGHYTVDHSAGLYLVDTQGRAAVYLPYGSKPEQISQDIKALLKS